MGKIDLTGQRFGRLTVISEAGRAKDRKVLWLCRCDCGGECVVSSNNLRRGNSSSCGCYCRERTSEVNTKHGLRKHPLYSVWHGMMRRTGLCGGARDKDRRNYISRGISVCDEWQRFENFSSWALSHGYEKGLQIDRIDNSRGYDPENCRWATPKQNVNNRRCTVCLSDGTPLAEFASSFGIVAHCSGETTKEYNRIRYSFRAHGEQSATTLVFDIALEQFADKHGFTYVENALEHI